MTTIAEKVTAEHRLLPVRPYDCLTGEGSDTFLRCKAEGCGFETDIRKAGVEFYAHVALVTEAAVRAQIAADIEAKIDEPFAAEDHWWPGLVAAARIAAGGAS